MNEGTSLFQLAFVGLTALGGGMGLSKLFSVRAANRRLTAESGKTGVEATAIFSESILKMLHEAQATADKASKQAETAMSEVFKCREELAYLRRWIIDQGLTPPNSRLEA